MPINVEGDDKMSKKWGDKEVEEKLDDSGMVKSSRYPAMVAGFCGIGFLVIIILALTGVI